MFCLVCSVCVLYLGPIVATSSLWFTSLCNSQCGRGDMSQYNYTWEWNQTADGRLPLLQSQGQGQYHQTSKSDRTGKDLDQQRQQERCATQYYSAS